MTALHLLALTLLAKVPHRDDRGDVPGWVLVTVMTAGLVAGLMTIADDQLQQLLRRALDSVQ